MNNAPGILNSASEIPGWGYALLALGILLLLLVVLDKAGYYLQKKKGTLICKDSVSKKDLEDAFVSAIKRYRTNGGGELVPGRADACVEHTKKLARIEVLIPTLDKKIEGVDAKVDRNYSEQIRSSQVISGEIQGIREDFRAK